MIRTVYIDLTSLGFLVLQIDLFKKAGWTIVTPPTPVIPDGTFTCIYSQAKTITSLTKNLALMDSSPNF